MTTNDLVWRKSTFSGPNGNCVEFAQHPEGGVVVRDSKGPEGPVLRFTAAAWQAWIEGCKAGEFGSA